MQSKKKFLLLSILLGAMLLISACSQHEDGGEVTASPEQEETVAQTEGADTEMANDVMQMTIGETKVDVKWEDNESVRALMDLCADEPLVIDMSMYDDFEQVGPIGTQLPASDSQTTTGPGDIVLYAGDHIVVFYGSNSWAYTRLGHITGKTEDELGELLGKGDITLTISRGK